MGCNCTKPPLMERRSEDLLEGDNLVEGDWSIIKQKKVKSHQNDIKSKVKKNLKNIIEKAIAEEEFNNALPPKILNYITENPYSTEIENENSENLVENEPVILNGGNYYWGQWNENVEMSGNGKYYLTEDNVLAEGYWKDGILIQARIFLPDGVYEGDILNNMFHGTGKMIYNDGRVYEGGWVNSSKEGIGMLSWPDGSKYWGHFEKDQINGEGEFIWTNGYKYKGLFVDGVFEGKGTLKAKNGNYYEGEFKEGLYDGHGKFIWEAVQKENKEKYIGSYKCGKKEGKGKYYFKNGLIYDGLWSNGLPNGQGQVESDFKIYKSIWKDGRMTQKPQEEIKENGRDESINLNFDSSNIQEEDIEYRELLYLDIIPPNMRETGLN
jgi:hypothetical protein